MDPFDFRWEARQRDRLEALVKEVDRLKRASEPGPKGGSLESRLERLDFENSELMLLVGVLVRILEAKQITTPVEILETIERISAERRAMAKG
jgi:hypothetical protein